MEIFVGRHNIITPEGFGFDAAAFAPYKFEDYFDLYINAFVTPIKDLAQLLTNGDDRFEITIRVRFDGTYDRNILNGNTETSFKIQGSKEEVGSFVQNPSKMSQLYYIAIHYCYAQYSSAAEAARTTVAGVKDIRLMTITDITDALKAGKFSLPTLRV